MARAPTGLTDRARGPMFVASPRSAEKGAAGVLEYVEAAFSTPPRSTASEEKRICREQMRPAAWSLFCQVLVIGLAFGAGGQVANAGKRKTSAAETKNRIALFPVIAAKGVNAGTIGAIEAALLDGVEAAKDLNILHGQELRRKLRTNPSRLVSKCEQRRRFAACFAKIAKKLQVRELVLARAAPGEDVTKLVVLAITPTRTVEARASLKLKNTKRVSTVMTRPTVLRMFGLDIPETVPPAVPLALTEASPEAQAAAEPNLGAEDPGSVMVGAGEQRESGLGASGASDEVASSTTATAEFSLARAPSLVESTTGGLTTTLDGWQSPPATITPTEQPDIGAHPVTPIESTSNPVLRYGGISLALVGAGALGAGIFFGTETDRYRKAITRDGSMNQHEALAAYNNANDAAQIATALFIGGGVVMALGATLFGIDLAF